MELEQDGCSHELQSQKSVWSQERMTWRCKNKVCKKTFPIPARISIKKVSHIVGTESFVVEKACCPFCEHIDIEEVKETTAK